MQFDSVFGRSPVEWLQVVLGALVLAWVLSQPDWTTVSTALTDLSVGIIAALVVVTFVGLVARFYTWAVLIEVFHPTTVETAGRIDLAVNFINQLLPSRVSGRVAAPVVVREFAGIEWNRSVAVVVMHTAYFAVVYGAFSLIGLAAGVSHFPFGIAVIILLSTTAYLGVGIALLLVGSKLDGKLSQFADIWGIRWVLGRIRARFPVDGDEVAPLVRTVLADRGATLRYLVAWTIALAIVPGLRIWLLFVGVGLSFSPVLLLPLYIVAAYSVTLLPLTPGGIGVTEATATVVFVALGVPETIAVPVVLLDRFIGVYLPAVVGWYPAVDIELPGIEGSN